MAAVAPRYCYDGRGIHLREIGIDMTLDDFIKQVIDVNFLNDDDDFIELIEEISIPLVQSIRGRKTFNTDSFEISAMYGGSSIQAHISKTISPTREGMIGEITAGGKKFVLKATFEGESAKSAVTESVINYLLYLNPETRPHVCGIYRILRHGVQIYRIMEHMAMPAEEIIMVKDGYPNQSTYSNGYESLALHTIHFVLEMAQRFESLRQSCDFVHGDFKADNVMLSSQGSYRLIDFGFSSMRIQTETYENFLLICESESVNYYGGLNNNGKNSDCRNLAQLFINMVFSTKLNKLNTLWGQTVDGSYSSALQLVHPVIQDVPKEVVNINRKINNKSEENVIGLSYTWFNDHRFEPTTNRNVIGRLTNVLDTLVREGKPITRTLHDFMRERGVIQLLDHSRGFQLEVLPAGLEIPVAGMVSVSRQSAKALKKKEENELLAEWNALSPAEKQAIYAAEEATKRKVASKQKVAPKQKAAAAPRGQKAAVEVEAPVAAVATLKRKVATPAPVAAPAVSSRAARAAARGQEAKGGNYTIGGKRLKLKHTLKRNKCTNKFHNSTRKHFKKHTSSRKRIHHRKY